MFHGFKKNLKLSFSFLKNKHLLLAVSGGVDSIVMLDLFVRTGFSVSVAHCNFKLRSKESDDDQQFITKVCHDYDTPLFTTNFATQILAKQQKKSIQILARELRYKWFSELLNNHGLDYLLTAHNLNDNIESFLFHTFRGTGLKGLTGIPIYYQHIVRPLSNFTREEILSYAKEQQLLWREDSSNASLKYQRNKIRHTISPAIRQVFPDYQKNFLNTKHYLHDSLLLIQNHIYDLKKSIFQTTIHGAISIEVERLKNLHPLSTYVFELFRTYGFNDPRQIINLFDAPSGKKTNSHTYELVKSRTHLILTELSSENTLSELSVSVDTIPFETTEHINLRFAQVSSIRYNDRTYAYFDKDKLSFPLTIRKVSGKNYYFQPLGFEGKKSISKFFKDEKIALDERRNIWGLFSANKLVWIIGHRADERFKVMPNTKTIVEASYLK